MGSFEAANNGKIVFTYKEAQERYGISAASFRTGIDQLTERGFIDVKATGVEHRKMTTLYAISDRWRQYGTDEFRTVKRPRSRSNPGFKKGNRLWQRQTEADNDIKVDDEAGIGFCYRYR